MLAAVCDRAFVGDDPLPRIGAAFAEQVKRARTRLPAVAEGAFRLLAAIAAEHHALTQRIARAAAGARRASRAEVRRAPRRARLSGILRGDAVGAARAPAALPRGARPAARQVSPRIPARDARHAAHGRRLVAALSRAAGAQPRGRPRRSPALEDFRWLLEELAVSLFAQELQDAVPGVLQAAWSGPGRTSTADGTDFLALATRNPPVLQ